MFRRRGGYRRVHATVEAVDAGEASQENLPPDRSRYASEISSSLSLQILIYYNGLLSAVYFALEGGLVIEKVSTLELTVYSYFAPGIYICRFPTTSAIPGNYYYTAVLRTNISGARACLQQQ